MYLARQVGGRVLRARSNFRLLPQHRIARMTESKPSKHSHKHHTPPTTPPPPEKRARRDSSDSSKEAHVAKAGDTPPSALIAQQHLDRKNGELIERSAS